MAIVPSMIDIAGIPLGSDVSNGMLQLSVEAEGSKAYSSIISRSGDASLCMA